MAEVWSEAARAYSHDEFILIKATLLCKAPVYSTSYMWCELCPGGRKMKQQRLQCTKPVCHPHGGETTVAELCPVRWKVLSCFSSGKYVIPVNKATHSGSSELIANVPRKAIITESICQFIMRNDLEGKFPKVMWSLLRKESQLLQPLGVNPSPDQVGNVIKYGRKKVVRETRSLRSKLISANTSSQTSTRISTSCLGPGWIVRDTPTLVTEQSKTLFCSAFRQGACSGVRSSLVASAGLVYSVSMPLSSSVASDFRPSLAALVASLECINCLLSSSLVGEPQGTMKRCLQVYQRFCRECSTNRCV